MRVVVFGLGISSSWGNGHATLWRGLCRGLRRLGHRVTFFERDVPYYAAHRDLFELPGGELRLYPDWESVRLAAAQCVARADAAIVTSFCPDALPAADLVLSSHVACRVFYDLDTPVTLDGLGTERRVAYMPPGGLGEFDLVLSYTGGSALRALRARLGARRVRALYGSADPDVHRPGAGRDAFRAELTHLGTYSRDRRAALDELLLRPAELRPDMLFTIGGAMYPDDFPWRPNIKYVPHVAPADHPSFYGSAPLTLNVTREPMARFGWCPSARLFESAACGVPVISDAWEGLAEFFVPGDEILVARGAEDVVAALDRDVRELARIGRRARERVLDEHTALHRAIELEGAIESAASSWGAAGEGA